MTPEKKEYFIINIPFILPEYRINNGDKLTQDYNDWQKRKPIEGKEKVRINKKEYLKKRKFWLSRKKQAKIKWNQWKSKNPKYTQEQSTKKYEEIKENLKANNKYRPTRFLLKKKSNINLIKKWENRFPNPFYESESGKNTFVRNNLEVSIENMRRLTPVKAIKDLLFAHHQLVENGIMLSKAIKESLEEIIDL